MNNFPPINRLKNIKTITLAVQQGSIIVVSLKSFYITPA